MAKKLYVGSLAYSVTDEELKHFFSSEGSVSNAFVIKDKYSGRSKGFGFVEMENDDEATKAIEALNGQELNGRAVMVNEARPQEDRPDRRSGGNGGGGRNYGNDNSRRY
jgi:RNA recognition motif-containing protein